jgi:hypothetical protein
MAKFWQKSWQLGKGKTLYYHTNGGLRRHGCFTANMPRSHLYKQFGLIPVGEFLEDDE